MDNNRTRAWRLAQKSRNRSRDSHPPRSDFPKEKRWKLMYIRSKKLARAAQLGMDYPRVRSGQLARRAMEEYKYTAQ
ncbi:hypothetical protein [Leminorella grimontii]|nr:hypothetical protein [Leminorella grimontii]GKX58881.1 hypothetical protein SOASR031_11960 [Leminorella grimontii]